MPRNDRLLSLLHLTDLHLCSAEAEGHFWTSESPELELDPRDRRGLVGGLVRDLGKLGIRPDLVVVTGDLLDRGSDTGVPMAVELLSTLAERLGLDRARFVLVPGNHDVLRVLDESQRYARYDEIRRRFQGASPAAGVKPDLRVEHHDFSADLGVEVVAFNSCEKLDPAANEEHGSIGTTQRDRAEALLAASEGRGLFRIAAMHHHLERPAGTVRDDYSVMKDAGLLRLWLAERRFHLALHGHQHVDWQISLSESGWYLSIVAGASAGVARYGRAEWQLQLGYQVVVVDSPSQGRCFRREYDVQHREWIDAGRGQAVKHLQFGPAVVAPPPATVPPRGRPTLHSVRKLLSEVLKGDEDFDAFCLNHFESVYRRFSAGMDRIRKTTLLLTHVEPEAVVRALREQDPEAFARHQALIKLGP